MKQLSNTLRIGLMLSLFTPMPFVDFLAIGVIDSNAQSPFGPSVDWRNIMIPTFTSPWGKNYAWDGTSYVVSQVSTSVALTPESSGEDWWYAHCNLYANNQHIGYAAVGYNTVPNWGYADQTGCFEEEISGTGSSEEFETPSNRKGALRQWIARFDLDGNMVWCRSYLPGVLYGVTQGEDGSIVATGEAHTNRRSENPANPGMAWALNYNPGITNSGNLTGLDCTTSGLGVLEKKNTVIKVDLNGQVLWQNFYGIPITTADGWGVSSGGGAIKTARVNGGPGYYVACSGQTGNNALPGEHAYVLRLDDGGNIVDRHVFYAGDPALVAIGVANIGTVRPLAMDLRNIAGVERVAISGFVENVPDKKRAFFWYIDDAPNAPFTVTAAQVTNMPHLLVDHITSLDQYCTGVVLAEEGGVPTVLWPVLSNYSTPTYAGRSIATLKVHRYTPQTNTLNWTANLNEVRAYDLQADGVFTADGHVAMVSSKWAAPYNASNPFGWNDLPSSIQDCISTDFPFPWNNTDKYDYWNTDAYVAKLNLSSGLVVWETQFDSDPETDHACWPGDIRKQECMYKITEAPDGGLVVSGNTSHNFDDGYLAKLRNDCQSKLTYESLPLDAEGTYVLPFSATWSADKDIVGRIVIPAGRTLSIASGATIRFADSQQMQWPTQVIVQPGGVLVMQNGATFSAVDGGCPSSMWDGVQVRGNYHLGQSLTSNQGYARLVSGATIEHARAALLAAWADPADPLGAIVKESTGGIIIASDAIFRNNRYDAVFHTYENRSSQGTVLANRGSFVRCSFKTQGDLNEEELFPKDHVAMLSVRGISFRGCSFGSSLVGSTYTWPFEKGTAIHSMNSSFTVTNDCSVLLPVGNPCPAANTTASSFSGLYRGILATTFDPSRTFAVRDASFTGTDLGIRMEGIQDAAIERNTFSVPEPSLPGIAGAVYGVYSDQCTGYSIQENQFFTTQPAGLNRKVGLVIKDSGPQYNTFYNNTFNNLFSGSLVQGKNADVRGSVGLEVKCNDYGMQNTNRFDVGLTGTHVRIQRSQGSAILNPNDIAEWSKAAGNRFSLLHSAGEEDWYVENTSTVVEYFNHLPAAGNRTVPVYRDLSYSFLAPQLVIWPGKAVACPSRLQTGGPVVKRELAEHEHEEYTDSKTAYDAAKDDGDTYSLLGYVSDPGNSSAQVRNALQSVAPKVSTEVWQAAFERNPTLSAWHITQALLSNSPLQGEVLKMVEVYALPTVYANLVYTAQSGEVNILSMMESSMAQHAGQKGEALTDLGRMAWLDSLGIDPQLDSLFLIHDALPAANSALAKSGIYAAKAEYSSLEALANAESTTSESPEVYSLLKLYAQAEQNTGWADAATVDISWLQQLGAQRDEVGSAQANAWLHALGYELPEEIIILPEEGPKSMGNPRSKPAVEWETGITMEVFPNPSNGPVYVVYEVPEGTQHAELRLLDLHGRILQSMRIGDGAGLQEWSTTGLAPGVYITELLLEGLASKQAKMVVQR